jgi:GTPase SAR1 family protein
MPASPQIFYGRGSELEQIIAALSKFPARVAIMGPGGMGKTSLALAALHHPNIEAEYPRRHFVSCESATSGPELISILGSHLGLGQSSQLSKDIFSHFLNSGPVVLVLDNLETPWEPSSTRAKVEDFLSLLTDVPQLALIVSGPQVHMETT